MFTKIVGPVASPCAKVWLNTLISLINTSLLGTIVGGLKKSIIY